MASESYEVEVELSMKTIWNFISVMDNWAPLVPGYIHHEIISDKESNWMFKTDLGFIKKKIQLKVNITNWIEPEKVTFDLKGLNEKISGKGYFEAKYIDKNQTKMIGYLEINPEGTLAKMIESKLKKNLADMTKEMTEEIINRIREIENVIK